MPGAKLGRKRSNQGRLEAPAECANLRQLLLNFAGITLPAAGRGQSSRIQKSDWQNLFHFLAILADMYNQESGMMDRSRLLHRESAILPGVAGGDPRSSVVVNTSVWGRLEHGRDVL